MKPYYDHAGITLYCGDCLEILRSGSIDDSSIDAVVTDVPYASGTRKELNKPGRGSMRRGERFAEAIENDQMTTPGFVWFIREMCYATRDLLKDGGSFLTFIDWRQWPTLLGAVESTNLRVNGMVVWDKISFGMGWGFRNQHELILHASKGTAAIYDRSIGTVLQCNRAEENHPSPKPPQLISTILEVVTPSDGIVLDPCAGAGATLVAAKATGRRAIGIEIDEAHCQTAAQRLRQEVLFPAEST